MKVRRITRIAMGIVMLVMGLFITMTSTKVSAATKKVGKVTISSVKTSSGNAKITWKKVSGASGYRVYRKVAGEEKYTKVADTTKLTYTDKKWSADPGVKISYKVRAYYKTSSKTTWGEYSAPKTWKVPAKKTSGVTFPVTINETTFPDQYLRNVATAFDKDGDGKLSQAEAEKVTVFKVDGDWDYSDCYINEDRFESLNYVRDFTGIKYFTKLKQFIVCWGNIGGTLDLSGMQSLEEVMISDNQSTWTSLDVSDCPNLTSCSAQVDYHLSSVKVQNCPNLTKLYAYRTQITSIDVSTCPKLNTLDVFMTPIKSIDVSKNPELEYLNLHSCMSLSSLDVTKNTKLISLDIRDTQIENLDVSKCTKLTDENYKR